MIEACYDPGSKFIWKFGTFSCDLKKIRIDFINSKGTLNPSKVDGWSNLEKLRTRQGNVNGQDSSARRVLYRRAPLTPDQDSQCKWKLFSRSFQKTDFQRYLPSQDRPSTHDLCVFWWQRTCQVTGGECLAGDCWRYWERGVRRTLMQKPTMRWVSLSFREVKFADIALVVGTWNLSQNTPPSKPQT